MRVKVCGLTLLRDLRLAERSGAAYVGFVVEAESPRSLRADAAALLARAAHAQRVYVTVDMEPDRLLALAEGTRPAAVQLHGSEDPDRIAGLRARLPAEVEVWRACSLPAQAGPRDVDEALGPAREASAAGVARVVLDARVGDRSGGTGVQLPIEQTAEFVQGCPVPCLLAGGLTPDDLMEVWRRARPWALDLSSGLECRPGVKDPAKVRRLGEILSAAEVE